MRFGRFPGRDYVALILAAALFVAVFGATVGVVYAVIHNEQREVGASAMQLLTALFGGIIAILGAYVGSGTPNGNGNGDEKKEADKKEEDG